MAKYVEAATDWSEKSSLIPYIKITGLNIYLVVLFCR